MYHIFLMNLLVLAALAALAPLATVPEPLYNVGQFLLGLLFLIGSAGRP